MRKYNLNIDGEIIEVFASNMDEAIEQAQEILSEYDDEDLECSIQEAQGNYSFSDIENEFDYGTNFHFEKLM